MLPSCCTQPTAHQDPACGSGGRCAPAAESSSRDSLLVCLLRATMGTISGKVISLRQSLGNGGPESWVPEISNRHCCEHTLTGTAMVSDLWHLSVFSLHPAIYTSIGIPTLTPQKHETNIPSFFGMMVIISFVCGNTKVSLKEHRLNTYGSRYFSNTARNNSFHPKRMQSKAETWIVAHFLQRGKLVGDYLPDEVLNWDGIKTSCSYL